MESACEGSPSEKECVVWVSAHGSEPVPLGEGSLPTRSQRTMIQYNGHMKLLHLSMAGLANVTTEMGFIDEELKKDLIKHDEYLTEENIKRLDRRSTEVAILTFLVHNIYYNKCHVPHRAKLEEFLKEILVIEKLAAIDYAEGSPPTIIPNPYSNKSYSFTPNPREVGRSGHKGDATRSGIARLSGHPPHNPFWAFYGLFFVDTSDPEHKKFAISNLPADEHGIVDPLLIQKTNILTEDNYRTFWKPHLEQRDYSSVPNIFVSNIEDCDVYACLDIFKNFCDAIDGIRSEDIQSLYDAVSRAKTAIKDANDRLQQISRTVDEARAIFKKTGDDADVAEEKHKQLNEQIQIATRSVSKIETKLKAEFDAAEAKWQEASVNLAVAKGNHTQAIRAAQEVETEASQAIIATIKEFMDYVISSSSNKPILNTQVKNIIMSNRLRNIVKSGIYNKLLTTNQIIVFFGGLGYKILDLCDPACCKRAPLTNPRELDVVPQTDTQELAVEPSSYQKPHWSEVLLSFMEKTSSTNSKRKRALPGSGGGTTRKKSMRSYSRKRRSRRKNHTRRRRR